MCLRNIKFTILVLFIIIAFLEEQVGENELNDLNFSSRKFPSMTEVSKVVEEDSECDHQDIFFKKLRCTVYKNGHNRVKISLNSISCKGGKPFNVSITDWNKGEMLIWTFSACEVNVPIRPRRKLDFMVYRENGTICRNINSILLPGAPDPPTNLTVERLNGTNSNETSLLLEWNRPTCIYAENLTYYQIEDLDNPCLDKSDDCIILREGIQVQAKRPNITITLNRRTLYRFSVSACNEIKDNNFCTSSNVTFENIITFKEEKCTAYKNGRDEVRIVLSNCEGEDTYLSSTFYWNNHNNSVESYSEAIKVTKNFRRCEVIVPILPYKECNFTVERENNFICRSDSTSLHGAPCPPTNLTVERLNATNSNETSLLLKWNRPTCINADNLTYYQIEDLDHPCHVNSDDCIVLSDNIQGKLQNFTINLNNRTRYRFSLSACNEIDDINFCTCSNVTFPTSDNETDYQNYTSISSSDKTKYYSPTSFFERYSKNVNITETAKEFTTPATEKTSIERNVLIDDGTSNKKEIERPSTDRTVYGTSDVTESESSTGYPIVNNKYCVNCTIRDLNFGTTPIGEKVVLPCPPEYSGNISCECSSPPNFFEEEINFSCVPTWIQNIEAEILTKPPLEVMQTLSTNIVNSNRKYGKEIGKIITIVEDIQKKFFENGTNFNESEIVDFTQYSINVISNLLEKNNSVGWQTDKKEHREEYLGKVFKLIETLGMSLIDANFSSNLYINDSNIDFKIISFKKSKEIVFPASSASKEFLSQIFLPENAIGWAEEEDIPASAVAALFRNIDAIFSDQTTEDGRLVSQVISLTVGKRKHVSLNRNVLITHLSLSLPKKHLRENCVFWNEANDRWNSSGCSFRSRNKTHIVCECSHLTTLAVLMNIHHPVEETFALKVLSLICTMLSILSLTTTIVILRGFRSLRGRKNTITCNLCVTLLVVNIFVLLGLSRTNNLSFCQCLALGLHYFLLSAFVWMFLEGYMIYRNIIVVLDKKRDIEMKYLYFLGYASPLFVVAITAGMRLEDYGEGYPCWISTNHGTAWSFVGPASAVMMANFIVFGFALRKATISSFKKVGCTFSVALGLTKAAFSLMCVMGLSWITIYLHVDESTKFFTYIFCFFNASQGTFILLFHVVLHERVRNTIVHYYRRRKSSAELFSSSGKARPYSGYIPRARISGSTTLQNGFN